MINPLRQVTDVIVKYVTGALAVFTAFFILKSNISREERKKISAESEKAGSKKREEALKGRLKHEKEVGSISTDDKRDKLRKYSRD